MSSDVCVLLLAGGEGTRMKNSIPKQFLALKEKVIARYSFDLFQKISSIKEIVVVCAAQYRHYFNDHLPSTLLTFALPGVRRQDSVYNGLQAMVSKSSFICIHDAVRPFITVPLVERVIEAAIIYGAAAAAMPIKFTVKEADMHHFVRYTPNRSYIWEIQTPQIIQIHLLQKGLEYAHHHQLTVTDDVSLVELLQHPVKLIEGSYDNLKITTPEDLLVSESLLKL